MARERKTSLPTFGWHGPVVSRGHLWLSWQQAPTPLPPFPPAPPARATRASDMSPACCLCTRSRSCADGQGQIERARPDIPVKSRILISLKRMIRFELSRHWSSDLCPPALIQSATEERRGGGRATPVSCEMMEGGNIGQWGWLQGPASAPTGPHHLTCFRAPQPCQRVRRRTSSTRAVYPQALYPQALTAAADGLRSSLPLRIPPQPSTHLQSHSYSSSFVRN